MNIFIDFDGTLVDIRERHYRVYRYCCGARGGTPLSIDQYWNQKRDNVSWSEILRESSVASNDEKQFLNDFIGLIESPDQLATDQLFVGAKEALEKLARKNTLFLLSLRRNPDSLREQIMNLGISGFFSQILSGHSETKEGTLSVKADIIKNVIADIDTSVVVGDTEADIVAAKSIGATSVGVTSGIRSRTYLSTLKPDYLLNGITDVTELFA